MIRGHNRSQAKSCKSDLSQLGMPRQGECDTNINVALDYGLGNRQRSHRFRGNRDARRSFAHLLDNIRKKSTADAFDGRDCHVTDARAPKPFDVRAGSLKVLKNDENVSRNCLACRCQLDSIGKPFEQRRTDLRFEIQDLTIDGGRGDIQPPSGLAYRTRAANGIEIKQCGCMDTQIEVPLHIGV
jgi:hypothetical protein